jgi:uncharacterized protein YoxC
MDTSVSLTIIVVLLSVITLFFVLALVKVLQTLSEWRKLLELSRMHLVPLSHDISKLINDVRSIVKSVERQVDKMSEGVSAVRDTAINLRDFEATMQDRIERPLLEITALLSALLKGGQVFWRKFSKR